MVSVVCAARWHHCPDCELHWYGTDHECWNCGRVIPGDQFARAPSMNSLSGFGRAMTDSAWAQVRREIGVDPSD